jgi:cyclophilin family peptidyl-prolyl cis-trans isomerase
MTGVFLAGAAAASLLALGMAPHARADDAKPVVVIETSMGNITVELDPTKAPITVENYLKYVDAKFYDGTIYHRVMPGFMIQGGGMLPNMREKGTNPPIKLEAKNGLSNKRGTIAMARTNDPNSATAQFFINLVDNDFLDGSGGGYAVFGRVTEGLDVVDKIAQVRTATKGQHENVPVDSVTIKSIKRLPPPP